MRARLATLLSVLIVAVTLAAFIAPAVAATGEHCSSHLVKSGHWVAFDTYGGITDTVYPWWDFTYRHCGDGASPEHYYYRADRLRYGVDDGSFRYWNDTVHWSVNNLVGFSGAMTVVAWGSDVGGGVDKTITLSGVRATHMALRAWTLVDWQPGGSDSTIPTYQAELEFCCG